MTQTAPNAAEGVAELGDLLACIRDLLCSVANDLSAAAPTQRVPCIVAQRLEVLASQRQDGRVRAALLRSAIYIRLSWAEHAQIIDERLRYARIGMRLTYCADSAFVNYAHSRLMAMAAAGQHRRFLTLWSFLVAGAMQRPEHEWQLPLLLQSFLESKIAISSPRADAMIDRLLVSYLGDSARRYKEKSARDIIADVIAAIGSS